MRLKTVRIKNFKGFREASFNPTHFGCLVGENNSGKSTVLQAIVIGLNRPTQLSDDLFYDRATAVEIGLHFDGVLPADLSRLTPEQVAKIAPLVLNGEFSIAVRYRPGEKCDVTTQRLTPTEPRYRDDAISDALKGMTGAAVRRALVTAYPEFASEAPETLNIGQAKSYLAEQIGRLPAGQFQLVPAPLPTGMSTSITNLLPEPIYIPAVKNLTDDLKAAQSTPFGRLLGLLLEDMTPDLAEIHQTFQALDGRLNRIVQGEEIVDGRHEKVRALESTVETFLSENFPQVKVELHIPPPELKTILNAAQIFIDDGSRDLIDNKGDGIKRSLTFALLQTYVSHLGRATAEAGEDQPTPRPLIFLFEEPELYLHPKSQRVLFNTLGRIASAHQVVVTTHSPLFFAPGVTAAFVRVEKAPATPKPVGVLHPVEFALDPANAEVFRMARFENADAAFFSRRVVLFEGESDDAYCKHVAKMLNAEWDFDRKNIALVRVSGKGNFSKFRRFFDIFGIEVKIVADLDALFDGFQHLGTTAPLTQMRGDVLQHIDARAVALGIKAEPSLRQIKDRIHQNSWRDRHNAAKAAFRHMKETQSIDDGTLQYIDNLFIWEQDIARVKVCREDDQARSLLVPVLDGMCALGVCILSKGAIEDYYPESTPGNCSKPEKALGACELVTDAVIATGLSASLAAGREVELAEIFTEIFRDI
jgi:energy-coupling factor transporter ATP-binding protein EcfA2